MNIIEYRTVYSRVVSVVYTTVYSSAKNNVKYNFKLQYAEDKKYSVLEGLGQFSQPFWCWFKL